MKPLKYYIIRAIHNPEKIFRKINKILFGGRFRRRADLRKEKKQRKLDGSVLCFHDDDTKWSYAKTDEKGMITEIREQVVISENATVGIYYFHEGRTFVENALDMIVRNERVNNEFYVAPVYNYAIAEGKKFGICNIDMNQMHGTGTPEDLDKYIALIR